MEVNRDYIEWIRVIKERIRIAQMKAATAVHRELILFYWELGAILSYQMEKSDWGDKILDKVSKDLKQEFPQMKGFSKTNLKYILRFYNYFSLHLSNKTIKGHQAGDQIKDADKQEVTISHQAGDQLPNSLKSNVPKFIFEIVATIPWRHLIEIFTKSKSFEETVFYIQKTKENNWSRNVLGLQIKSDLFHREGNAVSNFKNTLPTPLSDLAQETLKDPYVFDFLQLTEDYKERDIENQLIKHIQHFLLELGKGFAFVGNQYAIEVAEKTYFLDLLFYHIKLKCYVVIELKNSEFKPEFAGKLNFYLSAVDSLLKEKEDKPTIGILLCREKDNIEAEFALRDINKPIGVSEFELTNELPEHLKSSLPTIEEIEQNLNK